MAEDDNTDPLAGKINRRTQRKKPKIRKPPKIIDDVEDGDIIKLLDLTATNRHHLEPGLLIRVTAVFHDTGEVIVRLWDDALRQTHGDLFIIQPEVRVEGVEFFVGGNTLMPVQSSPVFGGNK